mmetsp:Transcript_17661/g.24390  ORF Transcript_17661/g.24390 Transcript_17661/m.24390 type:complete len:220 (-) Transcript_17661:262-921(-)
MVSETKLHFSRTRSNRADIIIISYLSLLTILSASSRVLSSQRCLRKDTNSSWSIFPDPSKSTVSSSQSGNPSTTRSLKSPPVRRISRSNSPNSILPFLSTSHSKKSSFSFSFTTLGAILAARLDSIAPLISRSARSWSPAIRFSSASRAIVAVSSSLSIHWILRNSQKASRSRFSSCAPCFSSCSGSIPMSRITTTSSFLEMDPFLSISQMSNSLPSLR